MKGEVKKGWSFTSFEKNDQDPSLRFSIAIYKYISLLYIHYIYGQYWVTTLTHMQGTCLRPCKSAIGILVLLVLGRLHVIVLAIYQLA